MDENTRHILDIELAEAFDSGDKKTIVDIYSRQGFIDLKEGQIKSGFFLITQAYIYASQDLLEAAALPSLFLIFWSTILILLSSKYILSKKN